MQFKNWNKSLLNINIYILSATASQSHTVKNDHLFGITM